MASWAGLCRLPFGDHPARGTLFMEALLTSTLAVAVAEIGDKTQLLSLFLITRFRRRGAIILGLTLATLLNHGLSAVLGQWLSSIVPDDWVRWILGGSFIAVGVWLLIPDKDEAGPSRFDKLGAFWATFILFFLAEIGDKTQIATVLLAAQFQSVLWVTLGTTLGMLAANVPVILAGHWLMQRLPIGAAHKVASVLFISFGVWTLLAQ
ncbi:MAG: TMEM165/GDT1 family protein [Saccharospirillum sp.]